MFFYRNIFLGKGVLTRLHHISTTTNNINDGCNTHKVLFINYILINFQKCIYYIMLFIFDFLSNKELGG